MKLATITAQNTMLSSPYPVYCCCLYVGGQAAFDRYQQIAVQQRISRDQIETAQLNSQANWGWVPRGG